MSSKHFHFFDSNPFKHFNPFKNFNPFTANRTKKICFIVPTPTLMGREKLYIQMGFFVQST